MLLLNLKCYLTHSLHDCHHRNVIFRVFISVTVEKQQRFPAEFIHVMAFSLFCPWSYIMSVFRCYNGMYNTFLRYTLTITWRCLEFTSFLCQDSIAKTISCVLGFIIDFDGLMFVIAHRDICTCSQDYLEVLFNSTWAGRGFRFTSPNNHQIDIYVLLYSTFSS